MSEIKTVAAVVGYAAGIWGLGTLMPSDGEAALLFLVLAAALSFGFGLIVKYHVAVAFPAALSFALFVKWLPPAGDYSWVDNGPGTFEFYVLMAGFMFVVMGLSTSLGVVTARRKEGCLAGGRPSRCSGGDS